MRARSITARARPIGLLVAVDAGDRAGIAAPPVHDRGVHLDPALIGEDRAAAGVEMGIVLEHPHRRLDRVERGAARVEDRAAGVERAVQSGADRRLLLAA